MKLRSPFLRSGAVLLPRTGDRAAKSGARRCEPRRAALSSLLLCGARAPLAPPSRLPVAHRVFAVSLCLTGDLDLLVPQLLQVVGVGRPTPAAAGMLMLQATARVENAGVPAKGLTGQAYEGHYFWDMEVYILPFLIYTSPDIRALYAFKRVAWWPYSVAMRQVISTLTSKSTGWP